MLVWDNLLQVKDVPIAFPIKNSEKLEPLKEMYM